METRADRELTLIRRDLDELVKVAPRFIKTYSKEVQNVLRHECLGEWIPPVTDWKPSNPIIAVDFDGTLCEEKWPEIGEPITPVIEYVKKRQGEGAQIILWTNRMGKPLNDAVAWCTRQGIVLSAVNENLPEVIEGFGSDCRKIFATEYIDDRVVPVWTIETTYGHLGKEGL